ncbi:MAG TPA: hypothetical protein VH593_18495 [Ktedonobacteraceae bacterium]
MSNNRYESSFLSAGGSGYKAPPSPRWGIEEVLRQLRTCKNELAHNIMTLQQIAHEQERTEHHYERLGKAVTLLIEVVKEPVAGTLVTEEWRTNRDQAIMVLQEVLGGARQEEEIAEVEMTPFQKQFQETMHMLMASPDYLPALRYFRAAYEYRKHFSWLHESTETPDIIWQTGLSYALQTALVEYIVLKDPEALRAEIQAATGEDLAESIRIDAAWTEELTAATAATVRERFNLERFADHLARARIPDDVETLKQHIAAALISYHKRCEVGTVPDLWELML